MSNELELSSLTTFDALVAEGVITSGPYETIEHEDEGYPLQFRICPALSNKPHTVGAALNSTFDSSRKWGPGSDMVIPNDRIILTHINATHSLALNLFCVDRPQLLLLTMDSYQRQHQPLDHHDFAAALEVLRQFPNMYVIYNCGEAAGCSRVHKHLQGLRGPPWAFEVLTGEAGDGGANESGVPFRYFKHCFEGGFGNAAAGDLLSVYNGFLEKTRGILGGADGDGEGGDDVCPPHNVVLWKGWIIVVPRRKGRWEGASANAAGMLGSVWVAERDQVDNWVGLGIKNVLRELGVPK